MCVLRIMLDTYGLSAERAWNILGTYLEQLGTESFGATGALGECSRARCDEGSAPRGRRRYILAAMVARYGLAGRYNEPARLRADCPTSMHFARIDRTRARPTPP